MNITVKKKRKKQANAYVKDLNKSYHIFNKLRYRTNFKHLYENRNSVKTYST